MSRRKVNMSKGIFIPDITLEQFRIACFEAVEVLLAGSELLIKTIKQKIENGDNDE